MSNYKNRSGRRLRFLWITQCVLVDFVIKHINTCILIYLGHFQNPVFYLFLGGLGLGVGVGGPQCTNPIFSGF